MSVDLFVFIIKTRHKSFICSRPQCLQQCHTPPKPARNAGEAVPGWLTSKATDAISGTLPLQSSGGRTAPAPRPL